MKAARSPAAAECGGPVCFLRSPVALSCCCCFAAVGSTAGPRPRRAAERRVRRHAISPDRSESPQSGGAGIHLAAEGGPCLGRSPRRAGQRRDRRYRDRRRHRRRRQAIAAVNAGFFLLPSGDPSGIYKLQGQLVSDTRRPRGAVGIVRGASGLRLLFGRVAATMSLRVPRRAPRRGDGDRRRRHDPPARQADAVHAGVPPDTDTASDGPRVGRAREAAACHGGPPQTAGKTPIPRDGFVLSYGGTTAPPPLIALTHRHACRARHELHGVDGHRTIGSAPRPSSAEPVCSCWTGGSSPTGRSSS